MNHRLAFSETSGNDARHVLKNSQAPSDQKKRYSGLRILIAAGGSAGHLYPGLSLAESLTKKGCASTIAFVSSRRDGIERHIRGYRHYLISIRPFGFSFRKSLQAIYGFFKSFIESFFIIERFRPDIIIGFGSYVSFPILLEAALFKKHALIHEQNISLGLANRALSFFVDKVAVSFQETAAFCPKCIFTGNPLRSSFIIEDKEKARHFFSLGEKFTILALGGSQGAHRINREFQNAVISLEKKEEFQFIHLTGKSDYFDLKKTYSYITIRHCIFDFLAEMQMAYSLADLVICRAGAGTITELAFFKKAAILIPYPYAAGHQLENAVALRRKNAAVVIEEKDLAADMLCSQITRLMHVSAERKELQENISAFAVANASERLADAALSLMR